MYRSKGWKNPSKPLGNVLNNAMYNSYEAGADAMLEALRRSNEPSCEVFSASCGAKAYGKSFKGKLVFIPDEEVLDGITSS